MLLKIVKITLSLCIASGIIGLISAMFLYTLDITTTILNKYPGLIWGLPVVGLFVGYIYKKYGKEANKGINYIIQSCQDTKMEIPFRIAPFIYFSTVFSHLVGASVGREGTAVQVGGVIGEQSRKLLKVDDSFKSLFLLCGIAAGFSSVFGLPFAGSFFAIELCFNKNMKRWYVLPIFCCAFIAHLICIQTGIEHLIIPKIEVPHLSTQTLFYSAFTAIVCYAVGFAFVYFTKNFSSLLIFSIKNKQLHPFIGGLILILGYYIVGNGKFTGLGVETITSGFTVIQGKTDFFFKLLFTVIAVGSGFKGGEVTPLFFIGVTLASTLLLIIPLPLTFLAAICFVGVFSSATKLPLSSFVMGVELFGIEIAIFMLLVTSLTGFINKKQSIYS